MHTQRIAQCGPAPSCNFPRPASTGSMCQDWAMERSRSINCPGLSLDIIALHGGVRVICCARCPRCPRGHAPLFSGGVAAFSVRRGEQGRSWGLVTGGPGGIKRSRVTEHHLGVECPHVTMCTIRQILHTLNVSFNLYHQTNCCIAYYKTCPTCSVL